MPLSSFLRQIAGSIDPTIRDARDIYDRVKAGIPLASQTLPAKLDPFGRPVEHRGSTGLSAFSPISTTPAKPLSDVDAELYRLGIAPGYVGRTLTVANQKVQLTPAEQRQ